MDGHSRHIDVERCKCGNGRIEIISKFDVYVAHLGFGYFSFAPLRKGLEQLFDRDKETSDSRFHSRLKCDSVRHMSNV